MLHVKHLLPTLGSCEIPVRTLGSLNTHTHTRICPSDVKWNQHQYLHNWVNSDFVHILLCRLLHQVRGNKAESSEKMMSIGTWRNTWGICRRKKKMASWQKKQKGVARHHNRQSHPCQSVVDLINWQAQGNIIHLQVEALVCLLHPFALDLNNAGVFAIPPWIQGFFQRACSLGKVLPVPRVHREREGRGQRGSVRDRRPRAGHPAGLGRASPGSGTKLQAAVSVLCSTTWLQKSLRLKWYLVWGRRI